MSKDIKLIWDSDLLSGDVEVKYGDFTYDDGIETAVLLSLFTDRRASNDDPILDPNNLDRRGWWGDLVDPFIEGDEIGSKLWLLDRSKTTTQTLDDIKRYLDEALEWMIEDGVATKIETEVERQGTPGNDILAFQVKIFKTDGREVSYNYDLQWEGV